MRSCPRCAAALVQREGHDVEVDFCTDCGGVFLDASEFDVLVAERFEGKRLESLFELIAEEAEEPLTCSGCGDAMLAVDYEGIELDRCAACGGIWLDGHERGEFARRAEEPEPTELDEVVVCSGCGQGELRRLCIKRFDHWWCEACVVAGNHPGVEAQLTDHKRLQAEAWAAFARAKSDQEEQRGAIEERKLNAERRRRRRRFGVISPEGELQLAFVEIVTRKISDWFGRGR